MTKPSRRILKLSPLIISQIAAGEVIDRPASVVKELVENAIDAGASRIVIQTWQGGMSRISVSDDGFGIMQDDLNLSVMRHTTSKLANEDVLCGVETLGFRGEALASIAAVARLKLASSADDTGIGYEINIEGDSVSTDLLTEQPDGLSQTHELKPVAMAKGTHVSVQDLFFNIPARRRFLKSIATEFGHIENIISKLALNYFDISFELWHDDQLRLSVNAVDNTNQVAQKKRLAILLDNQFAQSAMPMSVNLTHSMTNQVFAGTLSGWLSNSSWTDTSAKPKKQKIHQYWFVNGRLVQNRSLKLLVQQSIEQAINGFCHQPNLLHTVECEQALADVDEAFCVATLSNITFNYVLFLDVPEEIVNVNIHPTKLDVRLHNEQQILSYLAHFLEKQLRSMLDASAHHVLATESNRKKRAITQFGKAIYWDKKRILSQTDDGFVMIQSSKSITANSKEDVKQLLSDWKQLGQPQEVSVKAISFDVMMDVLSKLDSPEQYS